MLVMAESFLTIPNFSPSVSDAANALTECIRAIGIFVRERLIQLQSRQNVSKSKSSKRNSNVYDKDESEFLPIEDFVDSSTKMFALVDPLMEFGGKDSNKACFAVLRAQTLTAQGLLLHLRFQLA